MPSLAEKSTLSPKWTKSIGEELALPGWMSLSRFVPLAVPSVIQSSSPVVEELAENKIWSFNIGPNFKSLPELPGWISSTRSRIPFGVATASGRNVPFASAPVVLLDIISTPAMTKLAPRFLALMNAAPN